MKRKRFKATHNLKYDRGVTVRVANIKGVWRDRSGEHFGRVKPTDEAYGYVTRIKGR